MANSDGSNFRQSLLFPDHSATSQILSDLTFHLVTAGHEVHVITSTQIYDDPDAALSGFENINGVNASGRLNAIRPRAARSIIYRSIGRRAAVSKRLLGRGIRWS